MSLEKEVNKTTPVAAQSKKTVATSKKEYTPEQTADMSIDIAMTITCDVKPVFSSKVFKIEV